MAQGTLKSKKLTTATAKTSRKPTVLGPKKGARTIAPRKQVLVRNKGMVKVVTPFLFAFRSYLLEGQMQWVLALLS
jgi:hypothetical protein